LANTNWCEVMGAVCRIAVVDFVGAVVFDSVMALTLAWLDNRLPQGE